MSKPTTQALKAKGYVCRQVDGFYGQHYAIFLGERRVTSPVFTAQTARSAWAELAQYGECPPPSLIVRATDGAECRFP